MVEHGADLLESDTRKPIHELRRDRTIFEILEERRYRHARDAKHPDTAHAVGIPFNGRASRPIDHFFLIIRAPPRSILFPDTPLFRSARERRRRGVRVE